MPDNLNPEQREAMLMKALSNERGRTLIAS